MNLNTNDTLIKTENLKAAYGSLTILHDISFELKVGEIRAVLGGSGCGKSTLFNNILGLNTPVAGHLDLMGKSFDFPKDRVPIELLAKSGVLFQDGALISSMTVSQNVALPLTLHHPGLSSKLVEEMVLHTLERVQMVHAWNRLPGELSGGMRKRAALARALILNPPLIFCDEPSAGLDPLSSMELDELLLELRESQGLGILIITHELESIKTVADKILFLSQGHVLFDGTIEDSLNSNEDEITNFFERKAERTQANPFLKLDIKP
ncbi:ATP-binding cassette domain-containing protein [Fibrobacterales bacterium]|nr:ATP-binding cassette domain-containing protein [Fibrobacterales bacterium]